ncbi:nicotinate-nucleotide--dimethylbenzimidazole phosphoribosyltransferase [Gorillibacterium timonense]|uniref:nicotinate-nucleotide--dimethylbenzimidazole phosphoribosyltransferase n=1 Tax=Gorillibacterium timonense TaxID=1689269 RepID=UPI00071DD35A|nr:nicotinate-nucleotide--dimethylbenzimidazole phosphoribosyltransferase [Gorillibacterium timonense]
MATLDEMIGRVMPLDAEAIEEAKRRLDSLTKPPGSLGKLEKLVWQTAGVTGEVTPDLTKKAVIVMAGDHGVTEEGISAFPSEVTQQMVMNFLAGGAAVNVLARQAGAEVLCVDIGVDAELSHPDLIQRKIRRGAGNIARGPAMSRAEAEAAIRAGYELVAERAAAGCRVFATGEMGIGNTTPSAAVFMALTGVSAQEAVGRGTGIDDAGLARKRRVVEQALAVNAPSAEDPLGVLAAVGGLELAGLAGVILGAAAHRSLVVIDGFISSAAALAAVRLCPAAHDYIIASHVSEERGHARLLAELGLSPMLDLHMRLGEGTGAVLAFHLLDAAERIIREMATFESAGISGAREE